MAVGFPNQGFSKYPDPTTQVVDTVFKEFYLPAVRDLLNSKRVLLSMVGRNSEDVSGEHAVISLNVGRNEGIGSVGEQGKLPDPGKQQYARATYRMRYDYGRVLFTGQSVSSSRNDRGAFIRIMDAEIRGLARDMQHESNRHMFGDGSGIMAKVQSVAGTAIQVEDPGGFDNVGPGTQYLRAGMRVGIYQPASSTFIANGAGNRGFKILQVDPGADTITVDDGAGTPATLSVLAGDYVVRVSEEGIGSAETGSSGLFNESFGLAAIVDDGNPQGGAANYLGGIDASSTAVWNSAVIDNGGVAVPFGQGLLQQAEDSVDLAGDGLVDIWITTHGIRRQYIDSLVSQKRYVNTMKLDGGWNAVEYNNRPLVPDKDATRGRIYGLDLACLHIFAETDYNWMDGDGSILHRLPNADAYQAALYKYRQFGTDARNRHVVIKDIQD